MSRHQCLKFGSCVVFLFLIAFLGACTSGGDDGVEKVYLTEEDDDSGLPPTTTGATTTSSTVASTTTTTTGTTMPPYQLHATNDFNDAIDINISRDENGLISILGEWSFSTGLIDLMWYELVNVNVMADIPLTYIPDLSTPTTDYYSFKIEPFDGSVLHNLSDDIVYIDTTVSGPYGGGREFKDQITGRTMPDSCPDNYPPMLFGEDIYRRDCLTGEEENSFAFDYMMGAWKICTDDCVNLYLHHSNPDCDWISSQLFYFDRTFEEWERVEEYNSQPDICSWFTTHGNGLKIPLFEATHTLDTISEFKVTDDCSVASNAHKIKIYFVSAAYDSSAQSAGRNARLAEEVYYNDHGGEISGGYTCHLDDLLVYDNNLTDDPDVTFNFTACNCSGYTFTTTHRLGCGRVYTFSD